MDVWEYYKKNAAEGLLFAEAMSGISGMALQAVAMAMYDDAQVYFGGLVGFLRDLDSGRL